LSLILAIRIGLKPNEADQLTPYELNLMIEDYTEKIKDKQKSGIITAFYSAYFSKHDKLTGADLQKVLKNIDEPAKQIMSSGEMYSVVKRLAGV
jgi:hypothetical protein